MFGVPLFLMVTGALLLDLNRILTTKKLFRYLKRIIIALLAFSFIFMILQDAFEDGFQGNYLYRWIDIVLNGTSWAHMWYLYLMIAIYLFLPVLKIIVSKLDEKSLLFLIFSFVMISTIFSIVDDPGITLGAINIHISNVIYPTYLLLGYYFFNHKLGILPATILFISSSVIIIAGTIITGDFASLCSYSSFIVVMQAVGLYSLMLNINQNSSALIKDIDKCTFGIYLIHMIGVRCIMKWIGFNPYNFGIIAFIIMAVILFFVSYLITTLIKRIPKMNLL